MQNNEAVLLLLAKVRQTFATATQTATELLDVVAVNGNELLEAEHVLSTAYLANLDMTRTLNQIVNDMPIPASKAVVCNQIREAFGLQQQPVCYPELPANTPELPAKT